MDTQPKLALNPSSTTRWALMALIAIVFAIGHFGMLANQFVAFDDDQYIFLNKQVAQGLNTQTILWAFTSPNVGNYHPLTMLSHLLDVSLFGLNPAGHHATGFTLALINCLLLAHVIFKLTNAFYRSIAVALLFAAHPIHVESIAWASSRKDALSFLFVTLAILAYTRATNPSTSSPSSSSTRDTGHGTRDESTSSTSGGTRDTGHGTRDLLLLPSFFFFLALLSKPTAITLPAMLLLLDFWPLNRANAPAGAPLSQSIKIYLRALPRLILEKAPLLALALLFSILTFLVQRAQGAVAQSETFPLPARLLNAIVAYALYLKKLLLPTDLTFLYPHPTWWAPGAVALAALALLLAISLSLYLAFKHKKPYIPVAWLWFLGVMVPMLGLVQVGVQSMADRYAYLPFIGLYILIVWSLADLSSHLRLPPWLAPGALALCTCALTALSFQQTAYWHDSQSLFNQQLKVAGPHANIENNLAVTLMQMNKLEESLPHYQSALATSTNKAPIHANYAKALAKLGRTQEAQDQYRQALTLNPSLAAAWMALLKLQDADGQADKIPNTLMAFRAGCPTLAEPAFFLARIKAAQGDTAAAQSLYREAIQKNPGFVDAYNPLGILLAEQGDIAGAEPLFAKAVELDPSDTLARDNLARARQLLNTASKPATP
jgi:protein O-mannosyl-transferase